MNPPCARCTKVVYPVEKLNVLDQSFHKTCFTCETCDVDLTLKTYKGYKKKPYCHMHYPSTRFTVVADTPENKRLAKNAQNQQSIVYNKDEENDQYTPINADSKINNLQVAEVDPNQSPDSHGPVDEHYRPGDPDKEPSFQPPPPSTVTAGQNNNVKRYRAAYDYAAADDDEVSFLEGDIIIDVTVIDVGWMEGRVERTRQYGMIPSSYVIGPIDPPLDRRSIQDTGKKYVTIDDYAAAEEDEISFRKGDIIENVTDLTGGWMEGRVQRTGEYGIFPSNYVEMQ